MICEKGQRGRNTGSHGIIALYSRFCGALIGRADKGLFVTTGTFTRDAVREATRDGATPIDLIDGDQLADKLKELGLGIKTQMVESVDVDAEWFKNEDPAWDLQCCYFDSPFAMELLAD